MHTHAHSKFLCFRNVSREEVGEISGQISPTNILVFAQSFLQPVDRVTRVGIGQPCHDSEQQ